MTGLETIPAGAISSALLKSANEIYSIWEAKKDLKIKYGCFYDFMVSMNNNIIGEPDLDKVIALPIQGFDHRHALLSDYMVDAICSQSSSQYACWLLLAIELGAVQSKYMTAMETARTLSVRIRLTEQGMRKAMAKRQSYDDWKNLLKATIKPKPARVAVADKIVGAAISTALLESIIRVVGSDQVYGTQAGSFRCLLGKSGSISIKHTHAGLTMGYYAGCMNLNINQMHDIRRHTYGTVVDPEAALLRAIDIEVRKKNLERIGVVKVLTCLSTLIERLAAETRNNSVEAGKESITWEKLCNIAEKFYIILFTVQCLVVSKRYKKEVGEYMFYQLQDIIVNENLGPIDSGKRLLTINQTDFMRRLSKLRSGWKAKIKNLTTQGMNGAVAIFTENIEKEFYVYGITNLVKKCNEGLSSFRNWLTSVENWTIINCIRDNNAAVAFRRCAFQSTIYLA